MNTPIYFQFTLSAPQLEYLTDARYKMPRMAYFSDLVKSAALKPTPSRIPGSKDIIQTGQAEKSEVQLAKSWVATARPSPR